MSGTTLTPLLLVLLAATVLGMFMGWAVRSFRSNAELARLRELQNAERRRLEELAAEQRQHANDQLDGLRRQLEQQGEHARKLRSEHEALRDHAELQMRKIQHLERDLSFAQRRRGSAVSGADSSARQGASSRNATALGAAAPAALVAGSTPALGAPVLKRRFEQGDTDPHGLSGSDHDEHDPPLSEPVPLPGDDDFPSLAESELPELFDEDELGLTTEFDTDGNLIEALEAAEAAESHSLDDADSSAVADTVDEADAPETDAVDENTSDAEGDVIGETLDAATDMQDPDNSEGASSEQRHD
ncbi:MAG: hypothetical protein CSB44_11065 [Gammaproteobacteria bacterium]|nr:MAG: hypothetical protein CSB44_11065 [Gammaproteobacteria bacterium]